MFKPLSGSEGKKWLEWVSVDLFHIKVLIACSHEQLYSIICLEIHCIIINFKTSTCTSQCLREKYAELDCDIDGDCKGVRSKDAKPKADAEKTWSKCSRWVVIAYFILWYFSQLAIDNNWKRHTYLSGF